MNQRMYLVSSWVVGCASIVMFSINILFAAILIGTCSALRNKAERTERIPFSSKAQVAFLVYYMLLAIVLIAYPIITGFITSNPYGFVLLFCAPFLPAIISIEYNTYQRLVNSS